MKQKFIDAYMDVAERFAQLSTAEKLKVGAIIVKEDRIISIGYNGTPSGWSNVCEDVIVDGVSETLKTKDETIHAEANCIAKLTRSPENGVGAIMFLTHSPCIHCAKQIYTTGIKQIFYHTDYRDSSGVEFLRKCNIEVIKI